MEENVKNPANQHTDLPTQEESTEVLIPEIIEPEEAPRNKHKAPQDPLTARPPLWIDMLAIIGMYIVAILLGQLVAWFLMNTAKADEGFSLFTGYVVQLAIPIIFSLWLLTKRGRERKLLRFSIKKANPTLILWGFILVLIISVVLEPVIVLFPESNLEHLARVVGMGGWAMMMLIVAAPILEEILFRGIIQEEVTAEYNAFYGVLISAFIFGIAHINAPQQAVNAFFVGIVLGYIYIRTRSLVPVIVIHAMNNAISYILMQIWGTKMIYTRDLITNNVVYWMVYAMCAVIFVVACLNLWKQLKKLDTGGN